MTDIIFSSIVADLRSATKNNKHPFRYVTLATSDTTGIPRQRTVVLRSINDDFNLMIYTDSRSKKITHIKNNPKTSLLFYDAKRLLQVIITADAEIVTDHHMLKKIWDQIPQRSRKDYTTNLSPGKKIDKPDEPDYLEDIHFFTAIRFIPRQVEYLRLKRPNHIRALFKREKTAWKGSFIVP